MNTASFMTFTAQIDSAYNGMCQTALDKFSLSRTAFDILMFLYNNPEFYTAKEISAIRRIKPNVVSVHVEKLVHDGFLKREKVKNDRRKIRLVCTEKAEEAAKMGQKIQKDFYSRLIQQLTETDLKTFKHCFEVMAGNASAIQKENDR